ncbi:DUF4336 domain-containing protein [Chondromyces apiculatus]|uniref:Methanol oxidation protein n=1 Tax=Chondromyces apiculatus DSM 436 TaxID=1192034 RepID=A0A017T4K2_9BACT|nr:DUF4336 domain-containing protein [Chondromyces apiculatus]EYF03932.1 Hypothetical protein CAP_5033 [Chondromyces apiculatus DSM 436]
MAGMPQLTPFGTGLWIIAAPLKMLGMHLGTRMTVVRLQDGSVLLHSPIVIDDALAQEIDAIGPVRHIVAPNVFHHLYVAPAAARWPEARVYIAPGLTKKRPDLRPATLFTDSADLPFAGELEPLTIRGSMMDETVLLHRASKTLVSVDVVENFHATDHLPTRIYLQLSGVWKKPGWGRFMRFVYRDRKAARESIDRILRWDFDRLALAHGEPIETSAKEIVAQTFTFL